MEAAYQFTKPEDKPWTIEQAYTAGSYQTEKESCAAFDSLIEDSGLFKIYGENSGELLQPQLACAEKGVRIDRLLIPTAKLIEVGWTRGAVGVEIKKSGVKAGKPISQLLDYSKSVWRLPQSGCRLMCEYYFLWPLARQHGTIASIMAQNRIGSVCQADDGYGPSLHFFCGESPVIIHNLTGSRKTIVGGLKFGARVGSR